MDPTPPARYCSGECLRRAEYEARRVAGEQARWPEYFHDRGGHAGARYPLLRGQRSMEMMRLRVRPGNHLNGLSMRVAANTHSRCRAECTRVALASRP